MNEAEPGMNGDLLRGLQAFHQPLKDSFSREQNRLRRKQKRKRGVAQADESGTDKSDEDVLMKTGALVAKLQYAG